MLKQKGLYKRSGNGWRTRVAVVLALMFKHFFRFPQYQSSVYHCIAYSCIRTTICHKSLSHCINTCKPLRKFMPIIHSKKTQLHGSCDCTTDNITIHMVMTLDVCDSCCSWSISVCLGSTFNWTPCIVILASHPYLVHQNIQGYAVQILARLCKLPWISFDDYSYIPVI